MGLAVGAIEALRRHHADPDEQYRQQQHLCRQWRRHPERRHANPSQHYRHSNTSGSNAGGISNGGTLTIANSTITRRGKPYSYYICGGRSRRKRHGEKSLSHTLKVDGMDAAVFGMVVEFLHSPEGFGTEMQRRRGITAESEASLVRELESLGRQQKKEQEAEARAFRLGSRQEVSEEVFRQELGLIRTRQLRIAEERERLEQQLADIQRYSLDPQSVETLRQRLEARLASATPEDRGFILEAVGTKIIVQADGTWELELQVPRGTPDNPGGGTADETLMPADSLQVVNSRPESIYT